MFHRLPKRSELHGLILEATIIVVLLIEAVRFIWYVLSG
jgi:hypothetical protein